MSTSDYDVFADIVARGATNIPENWVLVGDVPMVGDKVDWSTMIEQIRWLADGGPVPPWRLIKIETP